MTETSLFTKLLVWFLIGLAVIVAFKVVLPLVMAIFGITLALLVLTVPLLIVGAFIYYVLRWLARPTA